MGDFFLVHNEEGRAYVRRLIYLNVILYIILAYVFLVWTVGQTMVIIIACIILLATILHILYYLYKNPPSEFDAGPSLSSE